MSSMDSILEVCRMFREVVYLCCGDEDGGASSDRTCWAVLTIRVDDIVLGVAPAQGHISHLE